MPVSRFLCVFVCEAIEGICPSIYSSIAPFLNFRIWHISYRCCPVIVFVWVGVNIWSDSFKWPTGTRRLMGALDWASITPSPKTSQKASCCEKGKITWFTSGWPKTVLLIDGKWDERTLQGGKKTPNTISIAIMMRCKSGNSHWWPNKWWTVLIAENETNSAS